MPSKRPRDEAEGITEATQMREAATAARDARIERVLRDPENARDLSNAVLADRFRCLARTVSEIRQRIGAPDHQTHPKARRFARVG